MRKRNFTRQVGLILSEETYNRLIDQTDKEEVTISEWVREAIEFRITNDRVKPKFHQRCEEKEKPQ